MRPSRPQPTAFFAAAALVGFSCGCSDYSAEHLKRAAEYEALDIRLAKPADEAQPIEGQAAGGEAAPPKPDDPMSRLHERVRNGGAVPADPAPAGEPGDPPGLEQKDDPGAGAAGNPAVPA